MIAELLQLKKYVFVVFPSKAIQSLLIMSVCSKRGWEAQTYDSLVSFKRREMIRSFLLSGLLLDFRRCCFMINGILFSRHLCVLRLMPCVFCPQTSGLQDEMKSRLLDVNKTPNLFQIITAQEAMVVFVVLVYLISCCG